MMLGDPETLMLNQQIIRTSGAKRILDIGVFTGASSLAAGLALPEDKARLPDGDSQIFRLYVFGTLGLKD